MSPHRTSRWLYPLLVGLLSPAALAQSHSTVFVGNSYTSFNSPHQLPASYVQIARDTGPETLKVTAEQVTKGGYTWSGHLADTDTAGEKMNNLLVAEPPGTYDVVILQEQSQTPGFHPFGPAQWSNSLTAVQGLDDRIEAAGAETVLFMTWGRRDGDVANPEIYPNFLTMQGLIDQGFHLYAEAAGTPERPVWVAPVGVAYRTIWEDLEAQGMSPSIANALFRRLYSTDGSHPAAPGTYLSALVIHATITGHDPTVTTWVADGVTAEDAATLREVARRVVIDNPWEPITYSWGQVDRYRWVHPWDDAIAAGTDPVTISGVLERPGIYVRDATVNAAAVSVGAPHDGAVGAGRLAVLDGGTLQLTGAITVGDGGTGRVEVRGGSLSADTITVGQGANGDGHVQLVSGSLETSAITVAGGRAQLDMIGGELQCQLIGFDWTQSGGAWRMTSLPATVDGNYTQGSDATLSIGPLSGGDEDPSLQVAGDASLGGTLQVQLAEGATGPFDVVRGLTIDAEALTFAPPDGANWAIVGTDDGRQVLRLTLVTEPSEPDPTSDVAEGEDGGGSDSAGPASDTIDNAPEDPAPAMDDSGCSATPWGTSGALALMGMALLGWRRRTQGVSP